MTGATVIRVADGRVTERHERVSPEALPELLERAPGEYRVDIGNTPLSPLPPPVLPLPVLNKYPSVEELTDALLKHLDGDVSAFAAIRTKLQK